MSTETQGEVLPETILFFSEQLAKTFLKEASRIIRKKLSNPLTNATLGKAMKRELIRFVAKLIRNAHKDMAIRPSPKYGGPMTLRPGEVRLSYAMLGRVMDRCESSMKQYVKILVAFEIITKRRERAVRLEDLPNWAETAESPIVPPRVKVLQLNFDLVKSFVGREAMLDPARTVMGQTRDQALRSPVLLARVPIPADGDELDVRFAEIAKNAVGRVLRETPDAFPPDQVPTAWSCEEGEDGIVGKIFSTPVSKRGMLIEEIPKIGANWQVLVAEGGLRKTRETRSLDALPTFPCGEFYSTWVGECGGWFYCPYIIWDIDWEGSVERARDLTKQLVAFLMRQGCRAPNIRIVFSTGKGFHVYLDSRVVGLKPSKTLHAEVRAFCMMLCPAADRSLYNMNHIIGIPNSRHRTTGGYYTILTPEELWQPLEHIRTLTSQQWTPMILQVVPRVVPKLANLWQETIPSGNLEASTHENSANETEIKSPGFSQVKPEFTVFNSFMGGVGRGDRDNTMFRITADMPDSGRTRDEALAICLEINRTFRPPLPEFQIRMMVDRAYSKRGKELRRTRILRHGAMLVRV